MVHAQEVDVSEELNFKVTSEETINPNPVSSSTAAGNPIPGGSEMNSDGGTSGVGIACPVPGGGGCTAVEINIHG